MGWRYGARIGSGGFGRVYEATYEQDDGIVLSGFALKHLLEEHLDDKEAVARFAREVQLVRDRLNHPNIVRIVAANVNATPPWFAMPRAQSTLREEIDGGGHQDDDEWVVLVFQQVLAGVAHAHSAEVLHRDLKPDNVLFVDGIPQIGDFGLGKQLDSQSTSITNSHVGLGTLAYMAPEQFSDMKRVQASADVYSLGKLLCEMLTGAAPQPFIHTTMGIPTRFRYFISKCCHQDPDERYTDAGQALAAFNEIVGELKVVQPPRDEAVGWINTWESVPPGDDLESIRHLDEHLRRHQGDEELYRAVVPDMPPDLIAQYANRLPSEFLEMLRAYDGHIQGGLPFSYCDVVADFYAKVWDRSSDPEVRRLLLSGLVQVGAWHNRWYVGGVVRDLIISIDDPGSAQLAADVLRAHTEEAIWFDGYLDGQQIPAAVAEAMASIRNPDPASASGEWEPPNDDIPF